MSLKDRLAKAEPRTATHQLRVEDDAAARAELDAARASGDKDRITASEADLQACYEPLALTAMSLPVWDDLLTKHQPSDEMRKLGRWCNPVTFLPAALVLCAPDSGVEEDDWAEYITQGLMAPGEAQALLEDLLMLHDRSPNSELPKGSTTTRS